MKQTNKPKKILGNPLCISGIRAQAGRRRNKFKAKNRADREQCKGLEQGCSGVDSVRQFGQWRTTKDREGLAQGSAGVGSDPWRERMGITRGLSKLDIGSGSMVHGKRFTKPGMVNKKRMAAKRIVKKAQTFKRGYFRSLKIRCYSCNVVGHKAINCPGKYLEVSSPVLHVPKDYLVKGTDLGTWDGYWFVDLSYKKHMTGNENMFKTLNKSPGVEIGFLDNNKLYSIGIGEVEIMINGQTRVIPGVNFVPALKKKNILSLNQLNDQGYNVTFDGDVCYINDMFAIMNGPNNTGELVGENEQENDYWSDYIEKLDDQSANELKLGKLEADLEGYFDSNIKQGESLIKNGQNLESLVSNDPTIWVTFLDTLHIPDYVEESKEALRIEFAKFVKWFYEEMFGQGNKEYPPKLPNGCAIELLDLYMFVEENGGYQNASKNNKWAEIAMKGLQEMYAANLRIIYQGYLDLMSWRYNMAKNSLKMVGEPSCSMDVKVESLIGDKDAFMKEDVHAGKLEEAPIDIEDVLKIGGSLLDEDLDDLNLEDYEDLDDFVLLDDGEPAED